MKKNKISSAFVGIIVALCLVPLLALPIVGKSAPVANEPPAAKPQFLLADGRLNGNFLSEVSDYYSSSFAFRREMVTAWAKLNGLLFHSSAQDQVVMGSEGWLYFSETLDDYMGVGLDDGLLENAANNLSLMQEYAGENGVEFVFTIAPNKNSLYPQYMPERIKENHSSSNAARLEKYLEEKGVNYAELFSAFQSQELLYYSGDSHWISQGAALAADRILAAAGRDTDFFSANFIQGPEHMGDLYEMLYPSLPPSEHDMVSDKSFSFQCPDGDGDGNAMNIRTENSMGSGNLLCYRDSFGIALYPYLAQSFKEAGFSRSSSYDLTGLANEETDTVIIELVERNLDYLVRNVPIFPAPQRELQADARGETAVAIAYTQDAKAKEQGLIKVGGEMDGGLWDAGTRMFISSGSKVYEAFVLQGEEDGALRFAAWLDSDARVDSVLCYCQGRLTAFDIIEK